MGANSQSKKRVTRTETIRCAGLLVSLVQDIAVQIGVRGCPVQALFGRALGSDSALILGCNLPFDKLGRARLPAVPRAQAIDRALVTRN